MDPNCSANGSCPLGPGVNSAVLSYFAKYPEPNINAGGAGDGYNQQEYTFASPAPQNLDTYIAKLDYSLSSRHQIFVRGNLQGDNISSPRQFPGGIPNSEQYSNNKGIAAGDVWTISNSLINNLRYAYIRQGYANRGATNSNFVNFASISAFTSTNNTSQIVSIPVNTVVDDLNWTKAQHTFQFGINYRGYTNNRAQDNALYTSANVTANYLTTGSIAGQGGSLDPGAFGLPAVNQSFYGSYNNAIADITGLVTQAFTYYNYLVDGDNLNTLPAGVWPSRHYISHEWEYYLQDTWKATPHLTLTYGIRQSLLLVPYERNGQEVQPSVNLNIGSTPGRPVQQRGRRFSPISPSSLQEKPTANPTCGPWTSWTSLRVLPSPTLLIFPPRALWESCSVERVKPRFGAAMASITTTSARP